MDNRTRVAFFAVTAALFLLLQVSLLKTFPLTDEAQFLTMARLLNSGKIPYRDFSDIHTPGLTYLTSAAFRAFGESYQGARAMMVVVSLATAFLLYFLGRRIFGEKAGLAAYLLFGIYSPVLHNFLLFALPFIAILTAGAAFLFLDYCEGGQKRKLFLAGFLLGVAWVIKQNAVLSMLGFFFALVIFKWLDNRKNIITACATFLSGWALPIFLMVLYLLSQGALSDFAGDVFGLEYSRYAGNTLNRYPIFDFKIQLVAAFSYVFILAFAAELFAAGRKPAPSHILLFSWSALSLIYAWPNFSYPSFIPVLIPGAICAGRFFSQEKWRTPAIGLAIAILFVSGYFYSHRAFRDEFSGNNEFGNYNFYEIPDYIRSHTRPGDTIYGFSGVVNYFLTGRNPASKHWFLRYYENNMEQRQTKIIDDLQKNAPKYIAYMPNQYIDLEKVSDYAPVVNTYILENYVVEKEFPNTPIGTVWLMVPKS